MAASTKNNEGWGKMKAARLDWADGRGPVIGLDPDVLYELGRSTSCNVHLDLPSVSGHHARLFVRDGRWILKDLGSTNGTFINGKPVVEGELSHGEELMLGVVVLRFMEEQEEKELLLPDPVTPTPTPTSTPAPISTPTPEAVPTPGLIPTSPLPAPQGASLSPLDKISRPILAFVSFAAGVLVVALLFFFLGTAREPLIVPAPEPVAVAVAPDVEEGEAPLPDEGIDEKALSSAAEPPARPALERLPLASFEDILHSRTQERAVVRLDRNPHILVFDFPDLESQARMFNRAAALIEKHGLPKDRVVRHYELASYIARDGKAEATFYYGHDYSSAALAHFFQLVAEDDDDPRDDERVLRDLLIDLGVIRYADGVYVSGEPPMAVVTIVQEGNPSSDGGRVSMDVRRTILRHELSHGEFFTNKEYRDYVMWFWHNEMTEEERGFFRDFLSKSDYNPQDDVLMANEMQAYLMHTDNERAFNPEMLGVTWETIRDLRGRFAEDAPETWMDEVFERLK